MARVEWKRLADVCQAVGEAVAAEGMDLVELCVPLLEGDAERIGLDVRLAVAG